MEASKTFGLEKLVKEAWTVQDQNPEIQTFTPLQNAKKGPPRFLRFHEMAVSNVALVRVSVVIGCIQEVDIRDIRKGALDVSFMCRISVVA